MMCSASKSSSWTEYHGCFNPSLMLILERKKNFLRGRRKGKVKHGERVEEERERSVKDVVSTEFFLASFSSFVRSRHQEEKKRV